ncbi:hypothetical protein [Streptomyces niveus]|uniref:hypothetical protein n=1 Tax=Streptomyces niveus TaxID=193462 RepID=UPI00366825A3
MTAAVGTLTLAGLMWRIVAGDDPQLARGSGLLLFLLVVFAVRAGLGHRKARITVAVVTPLLLVMMVTDALRVLILPDLYGTPEYWVVTVLAIICSCTGLTLLFTPRSNAYVRARTAVLAAK